MNHKFNQGDKVTVLNTVEGSIAETYQVTINDLLVSEDGNKNGYEIITPGGKVFQVSEERLIKLANSAPNWKRVQSA